MDEKEGQSNEGCGGMRERVCVNAMQVGKRRKRGDVEETGDGRRENEEEKRNERQRCRSARACTGSGQSRNQSPRPQAASQATVTLWPPSLRHSEDF